MKTLSKKIAALAITGCLAFGAVGCGGGGAAEKKYYNNDEDPLRFSTLEVDKVFNPFFSSSATDSNVVGFTQLGMLTNDAEGNVAYGPNEETYVLDYDTVLTGEKVSEENDTRKTTYYFVLKNNVKFSNGSPVTIKDVLFNLYVYLDMAYTGSSTIYSTDIVGLKEYRTQADDEGNQDAFKKKYQDLAEDRIQTIYDVWQTEIEENPYASYTADTFRTKLEEIADGGNAKYTHLVEDYDEMVKLFREELQNDYNNSKDSYEDVVFSDEDDKKYEDLLSTDVEAFLYNEGKLWFDKKEKVLKCDYTTDKEVASVKKWTEEFARERVFAEYVPAKIDQVVSYWATASNLLESLTNKEMEADAGNIDMKYKNISGIKFANGGTDRGGEDTVTVNDVAYPTPTYNADGSIKSGNEVLSIQINGVDPKAIWNFSFSVAPMYYYSDRAHIEAFDYVENFGVQWNSKSFMDNVVKNADRTGVPVGAGPYVASKESGGTSGVGKDDFYNNGVIYFEKNPHYIKPVKIKKVRLVVVSSTQMLNGLYTNIVDYAEPNAKPETITEVRKKKSSGISYEEVQTSGYGYVGVNAGKIPYLNVRRAIMYSINPQLCGDYYKNSAQILARSMSKSSKYYPKDSTPYYPYIGGKVPANLDVVDPAYKAYVTRLRKKEGDKLTDKEQKEFIKQLMTDPASLDSTSYVDNANYAFTLRNGIYKKGNHICRYTFTIAGEVTDHPAWSALYNAGQFLNQCGFEITVKNDAQALKKLNSGALTVWAAAWGSTIDPDMYQVYHKDSTATSVLNWGYPQILRNAGNVYDRENEMLDRLADLIEWGREYEEFEDREIYYHEALDVVMKLAVELPTYQRNDLFVYSSNKIDKSTLLTGDSVSAYKSPTSNLYNISLVVKTAAENEIA